MKKLHVLLPVDLHVALSSRRIMTGTQIKDQVEAALRAHLGL